MLILHLSACGADNPAHYISRLWVADDGLPHNCVQAVVQTRDGYLWVGTQSGLARFDGVRFTVFNQANVPQMQNPNIVALHESRDGSLWAASGWGGVLRLKDGKFVHYGKRDGLAHDAALSLIYESSDGAMWFGTFGGLSRLKDGKFTTLGETNGLSSNVVNDMCEDLQGNLWLATANGVDCWKNGAVTRHLSRADGLSRLDVRAVCCDCDGTVWFGAGAGLSKLQNGRINTFSEGQNAPYNSITRLYSDQHRNLWVGTQGGISRLVGGALVSEMNADGLRYDLVNAVLEDREENIWVGSRDGLIRFRPRRIQAYTQKQKLAHNNVISVLEDTAGTMWIGTWGGGLNRLDHDVITSYTHAGPAPVFVLGLLQDRSGQLWAGMDFDGGVFRLQGDSLQHFTARNGLPGRAVRVLYQDSSSNVWAGTSIGLYRALGDKFRPFGKEHGMGEETVRAIHQDRSGALWVGTEDGLWRIREDAPEKFGAAQGLSHNRVIAICEDSQGVLWFGTGGGGLNRFKEGRFTALTARQGLFSNGVCDILEDDHGWFWMTCLRGIFRVKRSDLEALADGRARTVSSFAYGKSDGMLTEMCSSVAKPGAWKSKDGRLWFATLKGLCVIDPSTQMESGFAPPPVVLERLIADGQPFPANAALPLGGTIRVPPGRGELEFQYTALSFRVPERNHFRYKLEGVDRNWVEAGTRRAAYYNNIYPGKYHFRVLACGNDGVWNEAGAMAELVLLPHLWQTWWFRVACLAAIALVVLGLHRLRLARFRELEALRLRIATDLHDEVGSNLSAISLLSRKVLKAGPVSQDAGEDLAALNRISSQTANAIREIVWFINPEYDTLNDLVLRMKEVARAMLVGIDCRFQVSHEHPTASLPLPLRQNLFLLFKETLANTARHSRASRVEISIAEHDHTLQLSIHDDGLGFDPGLEHPGNGLKNMRRRAARTGGTLDVQSRPGEGTTVSFSTRIS